MYQKLLFLGPALWLTEPKPWPLEGRRWSYVIQPPQPSAEKFSLRCLHAQRLQSSNPRRTNSVFVIECLKHTALLVRNQKTGFVLVMGE